MTTQLRLLAVVLSTGVIASAIPAHAQFVHARVLVLDDGRLAVERNARPRPDPVGEYTIRKEMQGNAVLLVERPHPLPRVLPPAAIDGFAPSGRLFRTVVHGPPASVVFPATVVWRPGDPLMIDGPIDFILSVYGTRLAGDPADSARPARRATRTSFSSLRPRPARTSGSEPTALRRTSPSASERELHEIYRANRAAANHRGRAFRRGLRAIAARNLAARRSR